jgi:bifunctional enzyme CysN/CysC
MDLAIVDGTQSIIEYTSPKETKGLLRFVICGSVDDGKSTLIGRLLHDAGLLYEDQLAALAKDSNRLGSTDHYDFSLLVDGLTAEREQKITLDVAYRYFSTTQRAFIVADAPGHVQYTHNMATAASTADLAVVLVDANRGILPQTRRHSMIAALLGIKQVVLVVNKMDLVQYTQEQFHLICDEYEHFARSLGTNTIHYIPVSALRGENIITYSPCMPWYKGHTLIECLEGISLPRDSEKQPFRMNVQWVNRPHAEFRGFAGRIASGQIMPGDRVKVLPSGKEAVVAEIVSFNGNLAKAEQGQSITLTFKEPVDSSRGDVIVSFDEPGPVADQLSAEIIWMSEKPMIAGRQYGMRIGTSHVLCTLAKPDYVVDINSLEQVPALELKHNQIGRCTLFLDRLVAYELYEQNRESGCFIISDKATNELVAAGVIRGGSQRSVVIPCQKLSVEPLMRASMKLQKPCVLWFTGLSGAGKSTIANLLEKKLHEAGLHTMLLDANNLRHGLNKDLGFTEEDRIENTRRISEVAKLMSDAGLITLVACIAPFAEERAVARNLIGESYIEVFVDAPLAVTEARDVRGLYAKARAGEITHFTGITSPYEPPQIPDLHLDTVKLSPDEAVQTVLDWLKNKKTFKVC